MITYENECCGCATENYPCMGSACPNRHVMHLICDKCDEDVETLYEYEGQQICAECLLKQFPKVEGE